MFHPFPRLASFYFMTDPCSPRLQERHRGFGEEPRLNLSANVPSTVSCPDFCASTNSSSVSWDLLYARNVH